MYPLPSATSSLPLIPQTPRFSPLKVISSEPVHAICTIHSNTTKIIYEVRKLILLDPPLFSRWKIALKSMTAEFPDSKGGGQSERHFPTTKHQIAGPSRSIYIHAKDVRVEAYPVPSQRGYENVYKTMLTILTHRNLPDCRRTNLDKNF